MGAKLKISITVLILMSIVNGLKVSQTVTGHDFRRHMLSQQRHKDQPLCMESQNCDLMACNYGVERYFMGQNSMQTVV